MGDYIFYSSFHFYCVFFELNSGGALLHRIWASFPRPTTIHCNLSLPDRIFNIILCQSRCLWLAHYHGHPVHASVTFVS